MIITIRPIFFFDTDCDTDCDTDTDTEFPFFRVDISFSDIMAKKIPS